MIPMPTSAWKYHIYSVKVSHDKCMKSIYTIISRKDIYTNKMKMQTGPSKDYRCRFLLSGSAGQIHFFRLQKELN